MSKRREYVFKILLLGDTAVGKTSLIDMYLSKKFTGDYRPTLGTNIITKKITLDDVNGPITVVLVIWDIAGQEKYKISRRMYFSGCSGALFVYDITRNPTLENIELNWLKDYKTHSGPQGVYLLIGNKVDLKENRSVSLEEGKELAEKINAAEFVETSAKDGDNVEQAFEQLVRQILLKQGVELEKLKREIPISTAEIIGEYKGLVRNRVIKALLQAYHDILDYDGMKSILREAGELDLRNIHAIEGDQMTKFFSFKKVMAAQNCLLYGCENLLFEIGKKFAFYLFPFGKDFEEIITEVNNLIQTDWTVELTEMNEESYTVKVENCIFCTETGVSCDLFEGFLVHSLQKTLPSNQYVAFEGKRKDPFDPKHKNFVIKLKIENLKT